MTGDIAESVHLWTKQSAAGPWTPSTTVGTRFPSFCWATPASWDSDVDGLGGVKR